MHCITYNSANHIMSMDSTTAAILARGQQFQGEAAARHIAREFYNTIPEAVAWVGRDIVQQNMCNYRNKHILTIYYYQYKQQPMV